MSAHSIDRQILHSLPLLDPDQKRSLLSVIKSFLRQQKSTQQAAQKEYDIEGNEPQQILREDFIAEYNREIELSEEQIEAGNIIPHEDIEKESEGW